MAERRCFSMKIVDSDAFLDMPLSTQCLYFHLGMRADDDGFVNSPRRIARLVGASDDDLKLLIAKRFILAFENGVIVIKHWRMQNTLKNDRNKMPQYPELAALVYVKANKSYTEMASEGISLMRLKCGNEETGTASHTNGSENIPLGIQTEESCFLREGNRTESNRTELNGVEGEDNDGQMSAATSQNVFSYLGGTIGQNVLMLTEAQQEELLNRLSFEEFNTYCKKLSDYIIANPEKTFKSHYKTILKWVEEDRSL